MQSSSIFYNKFWPTPTTEASVIVELSVLLPTNANTNKEYTFRAQVTLRTGASQHISGTVTAESKQHADLQAMYHLVKLLGEMLANATQIP